MKKRWSVEEVTGSQNGGREVRLVNAYPNDGPEHKLAPDCWCQPDVEEDTHARALIVVHNEVH
jgi:hypothetical protein